MGDFVIPEKDRVQKKSNGFVLPSENIEQPTSELDKLSSSYNTPFIIPEGGLKFDTPEYAAKMKAVDKTINKLSFVDGYNDDERAYLKKLANDNPHMSYDEWHDAVKTMGGEHQKQQGYQTYYIDKKGLPVPLAPGEKPPKGFDVESIWGTTPKDESLLATAGKHVANFIPDLVGAIGGAAATVQELITDKDAEWNKSLQQRLEADRAKYSEKSEESIFKDIHSFSDLAHISKYNFTPENIVGNIAGLASTIGQFVVMNAMTGGLKYASKVGKIGEELKLAEESFKAGTIGEDILTAIKGDQKLAKGIAFGKQLAASAVVNSTQFTEAADDAGLHGRDKAGFVTVGSTIAGLLEMELGIGNKILTAAQRTEKDAIIREGAKAIMKDAEGNITQKSLTEVYKNTLSGLTTWGKNVVKSAIPEATEEASQQFEQDALEQLHDKFYGQGKKVGEGKFGTEIGSGKELKSLAENAFWGAVGGGLGNVKGKAEGQSNSIYKAIEEGPEAIQNMKFNLDAAVKSGRMTESEKNLANFKIDTYQKYHSQLADLKLNNKEKRRLSDLTWSSENLKAQIEEDEKNPDITQPLLQSKLLAKKKLLSEHQAEINKIITKPISDQQTATAEKTQADIDKQKEEESEDYLGLNKTEKPETKVTPAKPKEKVELKSVKTTDENEIEHIKKIEELKTVDDVYRYSQILSSNLNKGEEVPTAVQNAIDNKIAILEGSQEEEKKPEEKKPEQPKKEDIAKDAYAKHLEALNKIEDDFSVQKNSEAFDFRKKEIKKVEAKTGVEVPAEIKKAIEEKETSAKKKAKQKDIDKIVSESKDEMDQAEQDLELLKKKEIKKNEVSFDKIDLDKFAETQMDDNQFVSHFKKHESFENEHTKSPSPGQIAALESLNRTGILNDKEASHEGSSMAEASESIHEAVKRIQYLKVNAKTDAEAKKLKAYQNDIMNMMSLPGKVESAKKHYEKVKEFADVNEKNAEQKLKDIEKEKGRLASVYAKEKSENKRSAIAKKILKLNELQKHIKDLHEVKKETKATPVAEQKVETKTPITNDIESKKADIERRRQEELATKQKDINLLRSNPKTREEAEKIVNEVMNETSFKEAIRRIEFLAPSALNKHYNNDFSYLKDAANEIEKLNKGQFDKINAKYDAELVTLEKEDINEQKQEENKQQEKESEKKSEPIDHTANLQSVIKEIDNNKGKPIKGNLTELPEQFNGKVGVELEINGQKQIVHIASSSTKVEQNANQKSKGKALQGQHGIVSKALVDSNAPVTLHLIKVGEVDAKKEPWNINGQHKNKYTGKPYGNKVEVWGPEGYIGVLQETVHPKEEAKLAQPKTDVEKLQEQFDEVSKRLLNVQEEKQKIQAEINPHTKDRKSFKFGTKEYWNTLSKEKEWGAERNKRIKELERKNFDILPKQQGVGISDIDIKIFIDNLIAKIAKMLAGETRKQAIEKGKKEMRKYIFANKEELTVEQAIEMEKEFSENFDKIVKEKTENKNEEDTLNNLKKKEADSNVQAMDAQARFFKEKEVMRKWYTGIKEFDNDAQTEKMLNDVMFNKEFVDGKPFAADLKKGINELFRQGKDEMNEQKLALAMHLQKLLDSKSKNLTGAEKLMQLSNFFSSVHNQPYIAMNIAINSKTKQQENQLLLANGAFEKTLKNRVLNALKNVTEKQYQEKYREFGKTKRTLEDQINYLKSLTGLEEKYWRRFIGAKSFQGVKTSEEQRLLKNVIYGWGNQQTPYIKTLKEFVDNLVNKKGSVINTITLETPAHEQLSVINPYFKDSEWNYRTSSSFTTHLINALSNVNNPVYQNEYYKNNKYAQMYKGKEKGAVIYMTSGASNVYKNKKFNAENMSDEDILKMMYEAYSKEIKDAPKENDGTYLQCLGQYGDKGFLAWTKVPKYTNVAEAEKYFKEVCKRNGLDAEYENNLLKSEVKKLGIDIIASEPSAMLFAYNYAINYAEVNEVVNGGLTQYGEDKKGVFNAKKGITALFKRNGSTASPGIAGNKYIEGGLGDSHGIVLINAPKMPLLDNEGNHIEIDGKKQYFSYGDGQEYITREHSDKASKSTGKKYHTIIKAITSFTNPNGNRVLVKSGAIVIDELVKKFPDNEAYKAILKTMKDAKVGRIVTVDAAKLSKGTEVYNLFKDGSHEINENAGEVSDKHIINVKTDDYLFQQDLLNDGKLKQSTTPIQRIKNMMGSKKSKEIQQAYNEIAKKKLEAFSNAIINTYDDKKAFTKFLLTNGKVSEEQAQDLLDAFDESEVTSDDLDFINTLLVAGVDTANPILHTWAQRFIGNTIKKEALGRIANKVQLVEFAHIPGKGFELRDYRKTKDNKTLLPEIAVPKSTGLRLPKVFKSKDAAIAAIVNDKAKYRDMYNGESNLNDDYGEILEYEIEKVGDVWIVPGEYAMVTRVPADGMHSTTLARVKHYTPDEMGNVIITSTQTQQLAGSDFDGDTRFVEGFFKSNEGHILTDKEGKPLLNKKGEKRLGKVASKKDTPKGNANKAFHTDAQYFYEPSNYDEITNPIDPNFADKFLEQVPAEKEYAKFGPNTFLDARTKNTAGLKVVGIAARYIGAYDYLKKHNAFAHSFDKNGNKQIINFPIGKIGQKSSGVAHIEKFASGWEMKKVMGNLLNLALDNVKNPKIERLGLNEVTAPMFYTSLMLKPKGTSVEEWTKNVIAYYTQPEVRKFVEKVRKAKSIFEKDKPTDIINKIDKREYNPQTGQFEEDNSMFSPAENKVLKFLKQQYFISQDIKKVGTVIKATEEGIQGWADYTYTKDIIDKINNNELKNLNTEKFAGSPFIQAAVESADAMKEFLKKDSFEETKLAQEIYNIIKNDDNGNTSLNGLKTYSKAISDSMLAKSRKLKDKWSAQRVAIINKMLEDKKNLPTDLQNLKQNTEEEKKLYEIGKAKNLILSMLDEKEEKAGEFIYDENGKRVQIQPYKTLGLRIDLQKQDLEPEEKKAVWNAFDLLAKERPNFINNLINVAIFDRRLSTSREGAGFTQLLSPKIHEQIGNDMLAEKEKWNNDSYSEKEQQAIIREIFDNNPELLNKRYEKTLGEGKVKKEYDDTFSEKQLPVKMVTQEKFDKVESGKDDKIVLSLQQNSSNYDTANKVKAGYILNMKLGNKTIQREVDKVEKGKESVTIIFKPKGQEDIEKKSFSKEQWENPINKNEEYSKERFDKSIGTAKTFMSNFEQLKNPIIDEFGNKYWNSEGYYMSQRTDDSEIKKEISKLSEKGGQESRNSRIKFKDAFMKFNATEENRKIFMLNAIRKKFTSNSELIKKLLETEGKEIIEKNYWKDDLFGVREDTKKGANILGKALMKVREELKQSSESWEKHKNELTQRHPDLTEEVWHGMSDMERKKAIECL